MIERQAGSDAVKESFDVSRARLISSHVKFVLQQPLFSTMTILHPDAQFTVSIKRSCPSQATPSGQDDDDPYVDPDLSRSRRWPESTKNERACRDCCAD
jgi:hypothetical protein